MKYYHGSNRGLRVGDFILPPAVTGKRSTSDFVANNVHRRDRVYVATDINGASLYAFVHEQPTVYVVEPIGDLEDDPDCDLPGLSFACERAKVIGVHKLPWKLINRARKALFRSRAAS